MQGLGRAGSYKAGGGSSSPPPALTPSLPAHRRSQQSSSAGDSLHGMTGRSRLRAARPWLGLGLGLKGLRDSRLDQALPLRQGDPGVPAPRSLLTPDRCSPWVPGLAPMAWARLRAGDAGYVLCSPDRGRGRAGDPCRCGEGQWPEETQGPSSRRDRDGFDPPALDLLQLQLQPRSPGSRHPADPLALGVEEADAGLG